MKLIRQILDCPKYLQVQSIGFNYERRKIAINFSSVRRLAECPLCNNSSSSVHSRYSRTIADLPWADWIVSLEIAVRKFFCRKPDCRRKVFCERLTALAAAYGRKTIRFCERICHMSLTAGASPGARLGQVLGLPASRNTLLRCIRRMDRPPQPTPRVLGIDDWAKRKGLNYGTILVDLERGQVIKLLADRESDTVANWLKAHPGVEVICRDRAECYADGARRGAPEARQVADRFHLIRNLVKVLQKVLDKHRSLLTDGDENLCDPLQDVFPIELHETIPALTSQGERRYENYKMARALHKEGWTRSAIGHHLGIKRHTVSDYVNASAFPDRRKGSKIDPYKSYMLKRWNEGCRTGTIIFEEIKKHGYKGKRSVALAYITRLREAQGLPPRSRAYTAKQVVTDKRAGKIKPREVAMLVVRREPSEKDLETIERIRSAHKDLEKGIALTELFTRLMRERCASEFDSWIEQAKGCSLAPFRGFAKNILRDYDAVRAAFEVPWSTSPVEGHISRLKMLKRQMYGRANLDLLEKRVLYQPP